MNQGNLTRRSQMGSLSQHRVNNRSLICKFHPTNDLHTFCVSAQCMLPMCSTCISIHNEDHFEMKTYGNYKNLHQMIKQTIQSIEEQQTVLEELSQQYVDDYSEKNNIPEKCKQTLYRARLKAHEQLDRIFDRFTLDIQQKMGIFTQKLHQIYSSLQQRIHGNYKILSKQRSDLSLAVQTHPSYSMTKRTNGYASTPSLATEPNANNSSMMHSNEWLRNAQMNTNEQKKQDRRVLKTLIEYYSSKSEEANLAKIHKLKQEIKQLKDVGFFIDFDPNEITKILSNLCLNSMKIRNNLQFRESRSSIKKKEVKFFNAGQIESQSELNISDFRQQAEKSGRHNNQKLRRMQIDSGQSRTRNEKMQCWQQKVYTNNSNQYRPDRM